MNKTLRNKFYPKRYFSGLNSLMKTRRKKEIKKLLNKDFSYPATDDEDFNVANADNGFVVSVNGSDKNGNWKSAKILCSSLEELTALIKDITEMERS